MVAYRSSVAWHGWFAKSCAALWTKRHIFSLGMYGSEWWIELAIGGWVGGWVGGSWRINHGLCGRLICYLAADGGMHVRPTRRFTIHSILHS